MSSKHSSLSNRLNSPRAGFANAATELERLCPVCRAKLLALGEEPMLLEELDGFIAGLLVWPDLLKPREWLQSSGFDPSQWSGSLASVSPLLFSNSA
jgi:Uncharacterised protein family (UPF0149)